MKSRLMVQCMLQSENSNGWSTVLPNKTSLLPPGQLCWRTNFKKGSLNSDPEDFNCSPRSQASVNDKTKAWTSENEYKTQKQYNSKIMYCRTAHLPGANTLEKAWVKSSRDLEPGFRTWPELTYKRSKNAKRVQMDGPSVACAILVISKSGTC